MEASDEIAVNVGVLDRFRSHLNERQISHKEGKVWTTDGIYRETNANKARKAAGAICVDMECSAVAALAKLRGVEIRHFFSMLQTTFEGNWDARNPDESCRLDEKVIKVVY